MLPAQGLAPVPPVHVLVGALVIDGQFGCSVDGVPGFDAVGLYGMVPEVLRFSVAFAVGTSFNQEVLLVVFCILGGCVIARFWSSSSSEDASASESGVERRKPGFVFSNKVEAEGH